MANGEGTATGKPNATELVGPLLNPRLGRLVAEGGGLVARPEEEGVAGTGAVPLLNSAHRGHLRFVSTSRTLVNVRRQRER